MNLSTMAPNHHHFMLNPLPMGEPVSRTYQYRKIMKPMLERKRRARINKCLDELKDLMTGTLQADGENVSKLEKADILELTVRHLHRLREHNSLFLTTRSTHMLDAAHGTTRTQLHNTTTTLPHLNTLSVEKFWAGFQHCATEVSQFLNKYDRNISGELIKHIASYMPNLMTPATATSATTTTRVIAHFAPLPSTTTANYQRCQIAATVNHAVATHLPRQERRESSFVGIKLEPEVKQQQQRQDGSLDVSVWRPW